MSAIVNAQRAATVVELDQKRAEKEAEEEAQRAAKAASKAAERDAKWTAEDNATIVRMIDEGSTYDKIASELGKDLKRMDIINRWHVYLKESSGIIKPAVPRGIKSCITWTAEDDAAIVRMRTDDISFVKIASKLGEQVESSPFHEGGVDGFGSVFFHLK